MAFDTVAETLEALRGLDRLIELDEPVSQVHEAAACLDLAARQGISLQVTQAARGWLIGQNDTPEYGARPLRRIIGRYLREPLADFLLNQQVSSAAEVIVDAGPDGLTFAINTRS